MKLSILIPVYNVENYLSDCIESVLNIPLDYEIIIINDGSTDRSVEILKKYQYNPIIKIIHQENQGISKTRNTLAHTAQGEYLWFLDSDDITNTKKLGEILQNATADLLFFDYHIINPQNKIIKKNLNRKFNNLQLDSMNPLDFFIYTTRKLRNLPLYIWHVIFKKELITNNQLFFENFYFEDLLFILELCYYGKSINFYPIPLVYYRKNRLNQVSDTYNFKNIQDRILIAERGHQKIQNMNIPEEQKNILKARMSILYFSAICLLGKLNPLEQTKITQLLQKNIKISKYYHQKCICVFASCLMFSFPLTIKMIKGFKHFF